MKIVDNKEVVKNVHLDVGFENGQFVISEKLDIVVVAKPLFEQIKNLIPGHFEDGLLDSALAKLEALASGQAQA